MQNRYKLIAASAILAAMWSAAPMAADPLGKVLNQPQAAPQAGSTASGAGGSSVTPRVDGGSSAPYSGMRTKKAASTAAAPMAASSGDTTTTASADTTRRAMKPKRDRN